MPFSTESFHEFFKRGLDVKRGSLLLNTQAYDLSAVARVVTPIKTALGRPEWLPIRQIDLKHFKSLEDTLCLRFVDPSKCDGCKGGEKTACMYICPNDLMILDPQEMKRTTRNPTPAGNAIPA